MATLFGYPIVTVEANGETTSPSLVMFPIEQPAIRYDVKGTHNELVNPRMVIGGVEIVEPMPEKPR